MSGGGEMSGEEVRQARHVVTRKSVSWSDWTSTPAFCGPESDCI